MVFEEYGGNPLIILFIVLLLFALILNYITGWSNSNKQSRKSRMAEGNRDDKIMGHGDMSPQARGLSNVKKRESRRSSKSETEDNLEEDFDYISDEDFGMDGLSINSRGDGPSMSHYHNKGPATESQALIDRYLAKVNFNMTSEDLDQPWFHRCATREVAEELLKGGDRGSFLVRPSSRRGSYAMSWVKDVGTGEVGHSLIYGLFPGFSLKQTPDLKERFWSIQSLIEHCSYLTSPVMCADYLGSKGTLGNNFSKTSSEVIGRMVEKLGVNDPSLMDVSWNICILGEGPENYNSSRCEKRTFVRYCDEEYAAPEILPLNGNGLKLVAEAATTNTILRSLTITGHEGYLRMSFKPVLGDDEAKAIAKLLEGNKSITSLNLSVNNITDVGAKAIAKSLKFNRFGQVISTSSGARVRSPTNPIARRRPKLKRVWYHFVKLTSKSEKTLIGIIGDAMKRRGELLGASPGVGSSLSSSNGASQARVAPLSVFHGYLSRKKAESRLLDQGAGSFLLYLNKYIPNVVFIAVVEDSMSSRMISHKRVARTRQGYMFIIGENINAQQSIPSLFEHCAWYIGSKQVLKEAADEYLSDDIRARLQDAQLLLGLWGVKKDSPLNNVHTTRTNHPPFNGPNNHPLYNNNNHSNNNNSNHSNNNNSNNSNHDNNKNKQGGDVYPTLTYLIYRNKSWLRKPIHAPQAKPPDELFHSM